MKRKSSVNVADTTKLPGNKQNIIEYKMPNDPTKTVSQGICVVFKESAAKSGYYDLVKIGFGVYDDTNYIK